MTASSFQTDRLVQALGVAACRFDVDALAECDSTNTQLLRRAEAGAPSGTVLVADRQTAGRGRRGRTWFAAPGDSLTFSLLWRFALESPAPGGLSLAVGLALARGLESLGVSGITLKWPNDLLLNGRKLGGVLVELQPGQLRSAVIGIGLNLHLPDDLPEDVRSLAAALDQSGMVMTRETVLAALLASLQRTLDEYAITGFAALREDWLLRHAHQGQPVRISGGTELEGLCAGVDAEGALLLQTDQGLRTVVSGDVSLRALFSS
ncbi:MAG TPA: biotin--[acetyl-CoA-carboxylase] ligase [Rhodocyclaceae bacterium]|jgi:BirA family biotin operon repressor/biotin-[acetyl-CoA-carboxylase] ligase